MPEPFIIMCAPNGARRGKSDHANIPLTPVELAGCAEEILAAGASMLHLHVRDEDGAHSLSVARYREAIAAIRGRVGDQLVIQATSEAVGKYSRDQQMEMVKNLEPEAVSLALREICPADADEPSTAVFFAWLHSRRIFPQIILYDKKDTLRFERMRKAGVFGEPYPFVLCVLGTYGMASAELPQDVTPFSSVLTPAKVPWAVCGFGTAEHRLAARALEFGGHVRVGFENNLQRIDGTPVESNAELVEGAYKCAQAAGFPVACAKDIRRRFMRQ